MSDSRQSEQAASEDRGISNPPPASEGELPTDAPVFARLGHIVRSLHDALHEIGADHVLAEAVSEFPSARDRLLHIATLTEKAANTVLSKVEETGPIQDKLARTAERLDTGWRNASNGTLSPDDLKALESDTKVFV